MAQRRGQTNCSPPHPPEPPWPGCVGAADWGASRTKPRQLFCSTFLYIQASLICHLGHLFWGPETRKTCAFEGLLSILIYVYVTNINNGRRSVLRPPPPRAPPSPLSMAAESLEPSRRLGACRTKTLTSSEFPQLVFLIMSFYVLLCWGKASSLPQMLFGIRQSMDE